MEYQDTQPNWKLRARIWICVLFVVTCAADYVLLRFSFDQYNPFPPILAVAVLGALCTKVALIGMWRRLSWARYALGTALVISILAFSVVLFVIIGGNMPRTRGFTRRPAVGIALQVLGLVPLARSRSIRRQMHPMTSRS